MSAIQLRIAHRNSPNYELILFGQARQQGAKISKSFTSRQAEFIATMPASEETSINVHQAAKRTFLFGLISTFATTM
jgi:hypothetical protein